jgi:selenide,water dikinase
MNLVGFPRLSLEISVLTEILRGGLEKIHEAGAVLVGGHTVEDPELKYGLSVTGTVHPRKILTNRGARAGDLLILSKAVGTGIVSTAVKGEMADPGVAQAAAHSMVRLNKESAEAMSEFTVHACTDITGFGLIGHASEMARASGVSFRLSFSRIPVLEGAMELARQGLVPAGAYCNQGFFEQGTRISGNVPELGKIILFDPQTSGGLLFAVAAPFAAGLVESLHASGDTAAAVVGRFLPAAAVRAGSLRVVP